MKMLKNLSFVQNYGFMWPYIKPYWGRALLAMILTIPLGSMDAVIAWSLKPYMDVVLVQKSVSHTTYIPLLIVFFGVAQSTLSYLINYLNTWVGGKITNDVKIDLFTKLMTYEAKFFDQTTSGDIQFKFNNDVNMACNGLITNAKLFTTRVFSSISLIAVLFYNSWQLAIIAVIILFGALFPLTTIRRKLKDVMDQTVASGSAVMTHYNEVFNGNRTITSYNLWDYQSRKFEDTLRFVFRTTIKMVQRTGIISPLMHLIISIGIAGIIWAGSYLIVKDTITPGNFVSFLTALIMLYNPIKGIGNNYNSVQMSFMAIERIRTIIGHIPAIISKPDAVPLTAVKESIRYSNVSFGYTANKPVLRKVNLDVKIGETIALVGNSGGGKSTFVNLLPRFYDIYDGSIQIDGVDIRNFELTSLRDKISIVFQDNFLFTGTIRDNIMLGNIDASEEELQRAVQNACLDEFIGTLKTGLDTQIGERGILLSGGQKQRVAIARAFLKNAPIVILDEATSALDNKSEAVVQQAITNLMKDRTVFVIAHRLSTVKNANRIVVINNGEIAEIGTHNELLAKDNSVYASLYKTQIS